jgi:hypothetical protein
MELDILQALLLCSFIAAPRMTGQFYLERPAIYRRAHALALFVVVAGAALHLPASAVIWPLFCALGFALHLRNQGGRVLSALGVATCIPFVFSLVSATWFVAGSNDLQMLGYDRAWSYYAALHGAVIGWLFVGCSAHLAMRARGRLYLWTCYLALPLFLLVAFGIDGVPHLKRVGAVGLSIIVPLVIGRYALDVRGRARTSFRLAIMSWFGVVASMTLALSNELWPSFRRIVFGLPTMVLIHGCLNALVVAPGFYLAIACDPAEGARDEHPD